MTHAELSRALEIPKSTCTYILRRLQREGLVTLDDASSRYRIGLGALRFAHDALREVALQAAAEPVLYQLADVTGFVAILGARVGTRVFTVDRVESAEFVHDCALKARSARYPSREHRGVRDEHSLTASAMGRAILAHMAPDELSGLARQDTVDQGDEIVVDAHLANELRYVRENGYAVTRQHSETDALAIAAPIFEGGAVNASVCITQNGLVSGNPDLTRLIKVVTAAGRDISKRLMPRLAEVKSRQSSVAGRNRSLQSHGSETGLPKLFHTAKPVFNGVPVRSQFTN